MALRSFIADQVEPWCQDQRCQDENRHGDIFNLLLRCWPNLLRGWRGPWLSRFFLGSVFLTHGLTVGERGAFDALLGLDPAAFDAAVIQPDQPRTAARAFPWVFELADGRWFALRDQLVALHRQLRQGSDVRGPLGGLGLRLRIAQLLLR